MKNKIKIFIIIVSLIIIGSILTSVIFNKIRNKSILKEDTQISEEKKEEIFDECTDEYELSKENEITEANSADEKVSANAILILKKFYLGCEHTINEYVEIPQDVVNMTEDEVKPFAEIQSIKATWPNKQAREVAMKRLLGMKKRLRTHTDTSSFTFDVNDQLTYHSPNDFRSTVARDLFMELLQAKERSEADASQLETLRERYHQADEQGRKELQQTILDAEKDLEALRVSIRNMEKAIRNEEIKSTN